MSVAETVMKDTIANKITRDTFVAHYGVSDLFKVYYTCFPANKGKSYECLKGQFDTCYSNTNYSERDWKDVSVPRIIPEKYHTAYLNFKNTEKPMIILG